MGKQSRRGRESRLAKKEEDKHLQDLLNAEIAKIAKIQEDLIKAKRAEVEKTVAEYLANKAAVEKNADTEEKPTDEAIIDMETSIVVGEFLTGQETSYQTAHQTINEILDALSDEDEARVNAALLKQQDTETDVAPLTPVTGAIIIYPQPLDLNVVPEAQEDDDAIPDDVEVINNADLAAIEAELNQQATSGWGGIITALGSFF